MRWFLDLGVSPDEAPYFGRTGLHWAIPGGHLEVIRLLLERGADPSIRDEMLHADADAMLRPNPQMDSEDPATTLYIESVWITPGLRRRRLGERLIKYLLTAEYLDNHYIRQFMLWVYATNDAAMRLYEHIGFVPTREINVGTRTEIKYRLDFNPELHTTIGLLAHGTHRQDLLYRGVTYRVLWPVGTLTKSHPPQCVLDR